MKPCSLLSAACLCSLLVSVDKGRSKKYSRALPSLWVHRGSHSRLDRVLFACVCALRIGSLNDGFAWNAHCRQVDGLPSKPGPGERQVKAEHGMAGNKRPENKVNVEIEGEGSFD